MKIAARNGCITSSAFCHPKLLNWSNPLMSNRELALVNRKSDVPKNVTIGSKAPAPPSSKTLPRPSVFAVTITFDPSPTAIEDTREPSPSLNVLTLRPEETDKTSSVLSPPAVTRSKSGTNATFQ